MDRERVVARRHEDAVGEQAPVGLVDRAEFCLEVFGDLRPEQLAISAMPTSIDGIEGARIRASCIVPSTDSNSASRASTKVAIRSSSDPAPMSGTPASGPASLEGMVDRGQHEVVEVVEVPEDRSV